MRKTIVVASLALAGCVSGPPYKPATLPAQGLTDAQLYKSAVRVVASTGGVATNDASAGVVVSEWDERGTIGTDKIRYRWRVVVGDGTVRVDSDCESWMDSPGLAGSLAGGNKWTKCEAQENERGLGAKDIAGQIVEGARAVPVEPAPVVAPAPAPAETAPQPAAVEPAAAPVAQ